MTIAEQAKKKIFSVSLCVLCGYSNSNNGVTLQPSEALLNGS